MASTEHVPAHQDSEFTDNIEKKVHASSDKKTGHVDTVIYSDDKDEQLQLKQVEELEAHLASGAAEDSEYLVKDEHDVSIKVLSVRGLAGPGTVCRNPKPAKPAWSPAGLAGFSGAMSLAEESSDFNFQNV
ncbi:hypothetical protein BT96DRAFT_998997 [Gymnopus androsaceus JB14]|uniref:Uncharacterized protein n=1 Tax=Gymnopus androsaceus JB14 TaxID=1447944 RepID=A0A6A4H884_9AGAR|nr:hypothetical protein BT96DRAFT_998997 [Gymnopus androsaceus JB14]